MCAASYLIQRPTVEFSNPDHLVHQDGAHLKQNSSMVTTSLPDSVSNRLKAFHVHLPLH